jgi:hypothetical protein
MQRRGFLVAAGACALATAGPAFGDGLPVPPGNRMAFKVLHNGSPIGQHTLGFTTDGDALTIDIALDAQGHIAGIIPFTYAARIIERWQGGVFQSLDSQVNDNGNQLQVHARKTAAGYDIASSNQNHPEKVLPEYTAPPNTLPLTYWNRAVLNGTVLNVQTGHTYPAIVTSPGWEKVPDANGGTITARRYDVTGKLHLTIWYDINSQWSALALPLFGQITYEKIL